MLISRYFVYFIIYAFFGWIYETIYCTIQAAKWNNRGFLFGPVIPIYGVGGVVLTILSDMLSGGIIVYNYTWWQVFLVSFFGSIILEYVTSWGLEKLFHAYWWDYSDMPLNINGRVCLPFSICFGAAGLLIVYVIAPFIKDMTSWISPVGFEALSLLFMSIMSMDIAFTVSALTDFENSIVEMEKALNLKMDSIVEAAIDKGQNTMKIVKEKIPFKKHSSKEDDIEIFSKENIKQLFANMSKTSRAAISRVKGFRKSKKVDAKYMENALAEIKEHIKKGNTN